MNAPSMRPPPEQSPPLLFGSDSVTEGYYELEVQERRGKLETQLKHQDAVGLWYRSLTLYRRGVEGGWEYPGDEGPGVGMTMWGLQMQLVGLGVSSAKAGLDLLLAGYYSVAYAAIRHMLESFAQYLYVTVKPNEARLWYTQPGGLAAQQDPPRMLLMVQAIKAHPDIQNSKAADLVDKVYASWRLMSKGAHPSGQGITQTEGDGEGRHIYGATYRRDLCLVGFDHGLFAVSLLLPRALSWLRPQSEAWMADWEQLQRDVADWRGGLAAEIEEAEGDPTLTTGGEPEPAV